MISGSPLQQLESALTGGSAQRILGLAADALHEVPYDHADSIRTRAILESIVPRLPVAAWILGANHLQNLNADGAGDAAVRWLTIAAQAKVPPAIDRLANLHLYGRLVEASVPSALERLHELSQAGFQRFAWERALLLDYHGDKAASASAFLQACALGYPPAYYSLGLRLVPVDTDFARALLLRAADAKHPDAAQAAQTLTQDSKVAQLWYQRLKQNFDASKRVSRPDSGLVITRADRRAATRLQSLFAALEHPYIRVGADGDLELQGSEDLVSQFRATTHWQWQHAGAPKVGYMEDFVSRELRAHFLAFGGQHIARPGEYALHLENGAAEADLFTGEGYSYSVMTADTAVRIIERQIATASGFTTSQIEPLSMIAYQPGAEYHPHVDYFSAHQLAENHDQNNDTSGQRVATFLVCIKAPEAGGETRYPRLNCSVSYRDGRATMHYNVDGEGQPSDDSLHCGEPVESGEKWLLRTTLRERPRF